MTNFIIWGFAILLVLTILALLLRANLRTPSRRYENSASVGEVYDFWTEEPRLEYYWGEHLHAGYYGNPPIKKNFIQAKVDFIDEMIAWGVGQTHSTLMRRLENPSPNPGEGPVTMLDVGCGIGGSVRHLAKRWPQTAHVTGITISKAQIARAEALTQAQGVKNASFVECDALAMIFPDNSFDVVYAVESEMHMPDKNKFVSEMMRVVKPGGILILACWNVRDTRNAPLNKDEAAHIRLLVDEWRHAEFTSIRDYVDILEKYGLTHITAENWAPHTQPSWRASVFEPFRDPRAIITFNPKKSWIMVRDAYTILRYDEAFRKGLCEYGLIRGQKGG